MMKWPKCSGDMIGGKLAVHGTWWGFIFVDGGWSYQPCWWQPGGDPGKEEKLIEANGARDAFRCAGCRMIIIPENPLSPDAEREARALFGAGGKTRDTDAVRPQDDSVRKDGD